MGIALGVVAILVFGAILLLSVFVLTAYWSGDLLLPVEKLCLIAVAVWALMLIYSVGTHLRAYAGPTGSGGVASHLSGG